MVKMVVMDLDGTLLTDDKNISDYTLSILERCKKRGIKIGIATARSEQSGKRIINLIKPDITILNGGALVKNNDTIIYKRILPAKISDGIIAECLKRKNTGYLTAETDTGYYVSYSGPAYHPDYAYGKYYNFANPLSQETYKITVEIFDKQTAVEIGSKFNECKVTGFSGEHWHRFAHKEAEKMTAIERILDEEKISLDDIVTFGDDYNDIEMIQKGGTGIAMENGIQEIKEAADYICESNNNDGVAKWIERNILA
jgi:Cof subfamily protein (haloacid dehalogenase superfamily)